MMAKERLRIGILASGSEATTAAAIITAIHNGRIKDVDIGAVGFSNENDTRKKKFIDLDVPERLIFTVNPDDYRGGDKKVDQDGFGKELLQNLEDRGVNFVTQNGWLPYTPDIVVEKYRGAIFNQHPGPVPEFGGKGMYGKRVHAARLYLVRLTNRDWWTEAIVQEVRTGENYDQGSVIKSEKVGILLNDTVESLADHVLPVEHGIQIAMINDFVQGNIKRVPPRVPLVKPGEEEDLLFVKNRAKRLYPNG